MIVVIGNLHYGTPLRHLDSITSNVRYLMANPKDVSLVVFTGGEDVHPSFYNGVDKNISFTNIDRDVYEKKIFNFCAQHDIKRLGICRGSQFLNVMCGGYMFQHIENHVSSHKAYFSYDNTTREVTSTHHQLIGLPPNAIPLAWATPKRSDIYIGPDGEETDPPEYEIESALYPEFNSFGVQFHPEMMRNDTAGRIIFEKMAESFIKDSLYRRIIDDRNRKARYSRR
jgi:gamma-glutamyl-gamma-aminobutyrate hydrolase PuuD